MPTPSAAALHEQLIEQVLGAVENRWIERRIRYAAEQGLDPVKAARQAAGSMGYAHGGTYWSTTANGIQVRVEHGTEFTIPWRRVAEQALGTRRPQQMSLF